MNQTKITKELLEQDGWVTQEGDAALFCLMEKKIANRNPINASEDTDISLVLHTDFNIQQFAVSFPDGGKLNFSFEYLEQLQLFESMIDFYDAPF